MLEDSAARATPLIGRCIASTGAGAGDREGLPTKIARTTATEKCKQEIIKHLYPK